MIVFYTASYQGKEKYQEYYDVIRDAIRTFQVELISPEAGNYQEVLPVAKRQELGDPSLIHYEAIRQGIHKADCVIIEVSNEDFQLGHEATLAIMDKKPVLCLSLHEDFSKKISNDYFFGARYTRETVTGIIQDFFVRVGELSKSKRFNMFLYPSQLDYLAKAAKSEGMNVSEYIRHLINTDRRSTESG
jgi:hypothetical protein